MTKKGRTLLILASLLLGISLIFCLFCFLSPLLFLAIPSEDGLNILLFILSLFGCSATFGFELPGLVMCLILFIVALVLYLTNQKKEKAKLESDDSSKKEE